MSNTLQTISLATELLAPCRIVIVRSLFNQPVTDLLLEGAVKRLGQVASQLEQLTIVEVPGAIEIPLMAQQLLAGATDKPYDAVIALGAVIRGETDHYHYVCQQVSDGCLQVSLRYQRPVIFGVLTVDHVQQAIERLGGAKGHKGQYAAEAALQMIAVQQRITKE